MKKQHWVGIGAFTGMMILILDSKTVLNGASQAIELCVKTIIPSLFPFFILSILLTNSLSSAQIPFLRPLSKLFQIPAGADSLLICSFLGGYPVGAQCISTLYKKGAISKADANRLLAFCSNAGPAFIFGMVSFLFPERWIPWLLWFIHVISAFLVSGFFPGDHEICSPTEERAFSFSDAMWSALKAMGQVCGWVILFRIIITFLSRWILWIFPTHVQVMITGLLELTNGCVELRAIGDVSLRFIICSAMLALGGLCVAMQTASVTAGLNLRTYFLGKLLQTIFSILLSFFIIHQHWFLSISIIVVLSALPKFTQKNSSIPRILGV